MPIKKPINGKEIQHGNCITKNLSSQRVNDFAALKKAKAQEFEKINDKGRKFKIVPIIKGYKIVEIKPKNGQSKKSHTKGS